MTDQQTEPVPPLEEQASTDAVPPIEEQPPVEIDVLVEE